MCLALDCRLVSVFLQQNYIQDALVTPRLREAKKAAKVAAAAAVEPAPGAVRSETVGRTISSAEPTVASSGSRAPPANGGASVARDTYAEHMAEKVASSRGGSNGVAPAEDGDEDDDGDAEV